MKPTKDKLNHCWSVKITDMPSSGKVQYVQERLMDWIDSKMDRGYRLRHSIENSSIVVSHDRMYDIRIALRYLEQFAVESPKKHW